MAIESCFINSGFPKHIFTNMPIVGKRTELLIRDSRISAVTLTGSTPVGKSVASIAGKYLKKTVLELGGNDPYIILDDANIDKAVNGCIDGRILNAGQSCISAKRIIVTEVLYNTFVKKIKTLTYVFYTGKKGTGESEQQESVNKNWKYPTPESIDYSLLKKLC